MLVLQYYSTFGHWAEALSVATRHEGSSKGARGFKGGERGGFGGGDKPAAHHNGDSKGDHGTTATEWKLCQQF